MKLTPHFSLAEFLPPKIAAPAEIVANLEQLAVELLEPLRVAMNLRVFVTSGWRPTDAKKREEDHKAGIFRQYDHLDGNAADIYVAAGTPGWTPDPAISNAWRDYPTTWEWNTQAGFHWLRMNRSGHFGQIILEDHRVRLANPRRLWVHVASVTHKHPGHDDPLAILVSPAPGKYDAYKSEAFA
jgi:hypothetical protein